MWKKRQPTKVAVVEVGDHETDVFMVPLDGIDEFLRDNRREYDFGLGEMTAELGTSFLSVGASTGSKTLGAPVAATGGDALFVKSTTTKPITTTSLVMKPTVAVQVPKPPPPPPPPPKPAATPPKPTGIVGVLQAASNAVTQAVKTAVTQPMVTAGASAADAANKLNQSLASLVGQQNKAPTIAAPTTFTTAPSTIVKPGLTLSASGLTVSTPKISVSGSASIKPTVAAALTAPTGAVIDKAATALALAAASDAAFVKAGAPLVVKEAVMKTTAAPLLAAKLAESQPSKVIVPVPPVVTAKLDPGPYLTMKSSVEPLTQAKLAEDRPLAVMSQVASLAPAISSLPSAAVKALAEAAKPVLKADASKPIGTMLEQLQTYGGPEKCACIVARKKQGLAALGTQLPTLRGQLSTTKPFVASNRIDFQGQVLSALKQIEQNTGSEQLRSRLRALMAATGIK